MISVTRAVPSARWCMAYGEKLHKMLDYYDDVFLKMKEILPVIDEIIRNMKEAGSI